MLRKLNILLLFISISYSNYAQDLTATVKTVNSVAPGKEFTVEVSVNKPGINGFMKYFQDLPMGYTAADIDSKGGNFTFADNGAKIIWISPPSTDQFTISYKVTAPANGQGNISIGGKFSYVVGNERKTFDVVGQVITVGQASTPPLPVVKETPPPAETKPTPVETKPTPVETKPVVAETKPTPVAESKPTPVAETKPTPVEEKPKPVETKKETPAPVVVATPTKAPTSAAAASTPGRTYRVQIGAFNLKPQINGVPEPSTVVLDNGMTKYFSGNFKTYEEANKRKKEMVERGFNGAFIVSFENGKIVK